MNSQQQRLWEKQGINYCEGKRNTNRKKVVMFPGHGSQYPDMMFELYKKYQLVRKIYDKADELLQRLTNEKLTNCIFREFSSAAYVEEKINEAVIMQTSIYTANYAMYQLISAMGIQPDYMIGHSLGEFSSLACSGVFSFEDGFEIVYHRARVLEEMPVEERGAMISVKLDRKSDRFLVFMEKLKEKQIDAETSIYNSDKQTILSTNKGDVERVLELCKEDNITSVLLKTSHGFHSKRLSKAADQFYEVLRKYHYHVPDKKVFSTISERLYSFDEKEYDTESMAAYLKKQFVQPFNFNEDIKKLHFDYGVEDFIEAGTDSILANLVAVILKDEPVTVFTTNRKNSNDVYEFAKFVSKVELYNVGLETIGEEGMDTIENMESNNNQIKIEMSIEEIKGMILDIIVEKTGYPAELLEDDMDFEADLGIDSVKQADIITVFFERLKIDPKNMQDENMKFNTIHDICDSIERYIHTDSKENTENQQADTKVQIQIEDIYETVKNIIAEKTGYPVEIILNDMDFEADLGIDSVKQADIIAEIFQQYAIDREKYKNEFSDKTFNTIEEIAQNLYNHMTMGAANEGKEDFKNEVKVEKEESLSERIQHYSKENQHGRFISVSRKVAPILKQQLHSLEDKKVMVIEDSVDGSFTEELVRQLEVKHCTCAVIAMSHQNSYKNGISIFNMEDETLVEAFKKAHQMLGHIDGIINLQTLSLDGDFINQSNTQWEHKVNNAFNTIFYSVKEAYEEFEESEDAFCVTVGNVGGVFGTEHTTNLNPLLAVQSGFLKALKRELPNLYCKALDFNELTPIDTIAERIIQEIEIEDNHIEIGYVGDLRKTIVVIPKPINEKDMQQPHEYTSDDVILFGGGGRGIMNEFAKGILELYDATVILTGRDELPDGTQKYIHMSDEEYEAYKTEFMLEYRKEKPISTVMEILGEYERLKHRRQLYKNIKELQQKYNKVFYYQCDVSSYEQVIKLHETIQKEIGEVTGIISGAGLPSIGKVSKKDIIVARNVVRTKAMGFYNLFTLFNSPSLKFFHSVGSISGRFGMDGQVDYCAGSDIIVKMSALAAMHTSARVFTMDWTAWKEVGMAVHPSVEKIQEERGLHYLSVKEGVQKFLMELAFGGKSQEVLIFDSIGKDMRSEPQTEFIDPETHTLVNYVDSNQRILDQCEYPFIDKIKTLEPKMIEVEKKFEVGNERYLLEHKVKGNYVFAGVCHLEYYLEIIKLYHMITGTKLYYPLYLDDIEFKEFIKYFVENPLSIQGKVEVVEDNDQKITYNCQIHSDFINKKGMVLIKDRFHSEAKISVSRGNLQLKENYDIIEISKRGVQLDIDKFYRDTNNAIEFGVLFKYVEEAVYIEPNHYTGRVVVNEDNYLFKDKKYINTVMSPITVDCIGRIVLIGLYHEYGICAVPVNINNVIIYRPLFSGESVYVEVKVIEKNDKFVNSRFMVVNQKGEVIMKMDVGLKTIANYKNHSLIGE